MCFRRDKRAILVIRVGTCNATKIRTDHECNMWVLPSDSNVKIIRAELYHKKKLLNTFGQRSNANTFCFTNEIPSTILLFPFLGSEI
jgi:hypothetical protein